MPSPLPRRPTIVHDADTPPVETDDAQAEFETRRIGAILYDLGKLTLAQAEQVLAAQRRRGGRFGDLAVEAGFVTPADIEAALARQRGHPMLLPEDASRMSPDLRRFVADENLLSHYRSVRAQLELRWFDQTPERRALAVIGVRPGEGRTTTAAMLGVLLAQINARVLLIDACLSAPRLARALGVRDFLPLDQALADPSQLRHLGSAFGSFELSVIAPADGGGSVEMLHGRPFTDLLAQAGSDFDAILIDCPPAGSHEETLTLATRASGALVVARLGRSRTAELQTLAKRLRDRGVELVGSIGMRF